MGSILVPRHETEDKIILGKQVPKQKKVSRITSSIMSILYIVPNPRNKIESDMGGILVAEYETEDIIMGRIYLYPNTRQKRDVRFYEPQPRFSKTHVKSSARV